MNYIYNDIQSVTVHSKSNGERQSCFRITIEQENILNGKAFNIKITDDNDPTFLYNLLLSDEDFSTLKSQQGLRVDFDSFPKQFAKLLSDCKTRDGQFRLVLDDTDIEDTSFKSRAGCFLKVIESNDFKNLCHLSLRIAPGSDEDIRKHLCDKLNSLQNLLAQLKNDNARLQSQNEMYGKDLQQKERKTTELEFRIAEETSSVRFELSQQLALEREKRGCERIELEAKHQRVVQELQNDIALLNHRNNILAEAKRDLESSLKVSSLKNETAEKDLARVSSVNSELKSTVASLEDKIASFEQQLAGAQRHLAAVEKTRQDGSNALNQALRDLKASREREAALSANRNQREHQLQLKTCQLVQATEEKTQLEYELTAKRNKIAKLLTVVAILEKELESIRVECGLKTKQLSALEASEAERKKELEQITEKKNKLEEQVKEQENVIKMKNDVNTCLHRKLTEREALVSSHNVSAPNPSTYPISLNVSDLPTNRTMPPWMTGDATTSATAVSSMSALTVCSGTGRNESRNPVLDPSYLVPAVSDKPITKKTSSYFPTLRPALKKLPK